MEVQDGFIVGIFNYCDGWCERCRFTSRCRVFSDRAEIEASLDPSFKAIVGAPPLPSEAPPALPRWMQELLAEIDEAASRPPSPDEEAIECERRTALAQHRLQLQAMDYVSRVGNWLREHGDFSSTSVEHPGAVVVWYHTLIAAKVHRALHGLRDEFEDGHGPRDCDGSAKVALLGIERSRVAWQTAADLGLATASEAAGFCQQLAALGTCLEEFFPKARAFVRPGFDEPEQAARLWVDEG